MEKQLQSEIVKAVKQATLVSQKPFLSMREACEYMDCSLSFLIKKILPLVPRFRPGAAGAEEGRKVMISRSDLNRIIESTKECTGIRIPV